MSAKDKIKCRAIANNILLGKWGEYTGDNLDEIMAKVEEEYTLTNEMKSYIASLLNPNKGE